jgi:hypothetical protein
MQLLCLTKQRAPKRKGLTLLNLTWKKWWVDCIHARASKLLSIVLAIALWRDARDLGLASVNPPLD